MCIHASLLTLYPTEGFRGQRYIGMSWLKCVATFQGWQDVEVQQGIEEIQ